MIQKCRYKGMDFFIELQKFRSLVLGTSGNSFFSSMSLSAQGLTYSNPFLKAVIRGVLFLLLLIPLTEIYANSTVPDYETVNFERWELPLPQGYGVRGFLNLEQSSVFFRESTVTSEIGSLEPTPLADPWQRTHPNRLGIPGVQEPEVQQILGDYNQPHRAAWLSAVYHRSFLYRSHILKTLARYQVPPELYFIPFIESEFILTARSTSNALGMWQFVENSMAPWMEKNQYKDERLSFYQATEAGIAKLVDNYRVLGDWLLAAAAYNAGLGAVTRAVNRTGIRDFWELSRKGELPEQTQRYIPKLLASAAFIEHLGRNFSPPLWYPHIEWTQTMVPGGMPLDTLARDAGIDRDLLYHANINLLSGRTPPNERFYPVTLPTNSAPKLSTFLFVSGKTILQSVPHKVSEGETLWSIANTYQIPWEHIQTFNNLPNTNLRLHQILNIPLGTSDE